MHDRRLATILSIDVVGYSAMMQADATGLLGALNDLFRGVVKPSVSTNGGRVVKLLGDGALIEFQSAFQALTCAVDIQVRLRAHELPYSYASEILLRMGLHAVTFWWKRRTYLETRSISPRVCRPKPSRVASCFRAPWRSSQERISRIPCAVKECIG